MKFYNSASRYDTVPAGQTYLVADSGRLNANDMANGKVEIQPVTSDLKARIVFYDPTKNTQSDAAKFGRATPDSYGRTTALFNYNHRKINFDISEIYVELSKLEAGNNKKENIEKKFVLFPADLTSDRKTRNPGEYPQSSSDAIAGTNGIGVKEGNWRCLGNYAVVYDLYLTNVSGHRLTIYKQDAGILMMRINNGSWVSVSAEKGEYLYDRADLKSVSLIQLILVGGNTGDVFVEIDKA